ncbi:UDP-N-acetylglucosamine--dolichyl-phosphate N-acetylglucosaminyltransferase [Candidatus Burarchaeum australiense]|nr:UDP-N-acetylglucosamine--dolichyl-phosphate N-acetylglucosaminyltransferase [Candidatus Burarchaeum australiense]
MKRGRKREKANVIDIFLKKIERISRHLVRGASDSFDIPTLFKDVWRRVEGKSVSVIIPSYNEEKTVGGVIDAVKKADFVDEIIVVDDGSADRTSEMARKKGVGVIRHEKNLGKGAAIKTGIRKAGGKIILFLDADLENLKPAQITALIEPAVDGDATFVKSAFDGNGRVTELTVKPLLKFLFPHVQFSQPISGQFCARKEFLERIKLEKDYGMDIGILLDAVRMGETIKEVHIGKIEHRHRPIEARSKDAEQNIRTILKKAGLLRRIRRRKRR